MNVNVNASFEPKIVAFLCNWCAYAGADMAGTSRLKYPANVVPIRVMCSGRIDVEFIIDAFEKGADGVFIGGCHPGDCHYVSGNYRARRRVEMVKKLLSQMGVNEKRLRIEWVSATEGKKFATVIEEFVDEIKKLGPSPWRK
ncbi:MAG TPA: hydrogenase iron-sulfur subunit [Thermoplasmatales archaeon]|nr:hydrogenase iron-sulfur subunit [Thermoplasmatales archaeon]